MKRKIELIELIYDDFTEAKKFRETSRGIIVIDNMILIGYIEASDKYIIPGGELEGDETDDECLLRELKEETGLVCKIKKKYLRIDEYFGETKCSNGYYIVTPKIDMNKTFLTQNEIEEGFVSKWMNVDDVIKEFARYDEFERSNPEKYGLYKREHLALLSYLKNR